MSIIVGLGSPHGDDQLGWVAIDRLHPRLPAGISARKVRGGVELIDSLEGHDAAVIIDAAAPAGQPGMIRTFTWPCPELAGCAPTNTHGLGLVEGLRLAETLGRLPRSVIVHTIQARSTSPVDALGDEIAGQLDVLVESILESLAAHGIRD